MLQTSGNESTLFDAESAVGFNWTKKTFVASNDMSIEDLTENVKFVSVTFTDDTVAAEVDALIESISENDSEINRLDQQNKEKKARLDEIATARVKATRKVNSLMDYLREKWAVALLPFSMVVIGRKYKATKSKGSVGEPKPDYEKIISTFVTRHPKMKEEMEELKKTILTIPKNTASRWTNFSEIESDK